MRVRFLAAPVTTILFGLAFCVAEPRLAHAQPSAQTAPGAPSAEDEEKARGHFRLGRAYYDNGDFAQAATEFEAAYRISGKAALLYNIYLAYRDASDTRNAAEALRKYLQLEQKVENRGQLESRLAALDRSLAEESPAPLAAPAGAQAATSPQPTAAGSLQPTAATPSPAPETVAPPEMTANSERAHPNQLLPIILMGGGGALIAGSVVTGIMTLGKKSTLSDAQAACRKAGDCEALSPARVAELNSDKSSGKTLALVTDILLFGGIAVAGTGAVLFFLNRGKESAPPPATTASLACAPTACFGSVRSVF